MDREQFAEQVHALRQEGKSIRAIAAELGTYKTKVQRTLKHLTEHPSSGTPARNIVTGAFVGRQREMDELRAALDDAVSGSTRIIMLSGEPGIGKTRLAQEISDIAVDNDLRTLWGRCYEGQGAPSYWPWVQIVRDYVRELDSEQLRSEMGTGAANIAEIVSELKAKLPGLEPPTSLDSPDANRFRLFDSITSFLKNSAQRKPMVLVLEDLHWADRPSLLLLEFLAHEMSGSRILIVGTLRHTESEQAISQTIGELAREPYFQQIHLPRLEVSDVGQYIQETSGEIAPNELTSAIYSRTEGNPFFMTEMVRLLGHDPSTIAQGEHFSDDISMPDSVRGAIRRRLEGLSQTCNQALTIGSLIGREFSIEVVEALMLDTSIHQLSMELEEATKLRIVDELEGEVGRYQFSHVLIQEAISSELSNARKVALHAEIGESLEALYEHEIEAHAAELAYHFSEAEPVLGDLKLVRYSLMAGERALAAYAYEDALAHFQRALDVREDQTMDDQLATIKFGVGRAMTSMVRSDIETQPAWDAISQAFDYFAEKGEAEKAVDVAIHPLPGLGQISGAADLFARALELVPRDSLQAGYLHSRLAGSLEFEFADFEGSRNAAMEAITIARRENDEALEARGLSYLISPLLIDHRHQEAIEAGLKAVEIAQRIGDLQLDHSPQWLLARAFLIVGDPNRARIHASAAFQAGEKLHVRGVQFFGLLTSALCAAYQGDLLKANDLADQSLEIRLPNDLMRGLRAWINLQSDDVEAIKHLIENLSSNPDFIYSWLIRTAYETNNYEYMDMGEAAFLAWEPSTHALPSFWIGQCAAIVAVLRKDRAAASEHYSALAPDKGTVIFPALFSVDHVLGLLAQTMGNMADARTHFEEAITFCRKAGYRPELAWTCYDYADMLIQRNESGDFPKARELADEADQITSDLDMKPLDVRAAALREQLDARPSPKPEYPDGLTVREVEVLRLVASGRSNAEIAEELYLSVRTVERHISNIYSKTSSGGRAEATAFAFTHGLMPFN